MIDIKILSESSIHLDLLINGKEYSYATTPEINSKFRWLLSLNQGKALAFLRKEAELLNNGDYDPNFHIELPENEMKETAIEITEEMQIPGTNIILEVGDRIKVLTEFVEEDYYEEMARQFTDHWDVQFKLTSLKSSPERREILFTSNIDDTIKLVHSWRSDGTSSKPVTFLEVEMSLFDDPDDKYDMDKNLGRMPVWEDPKEYAEDIADFIDQYL